MKYLFESPEMVVRLMIELDSWRGTPFRQNIGKKGVGADCVGFIYRTFMNLGVCDPVTLPSYTVFQGGATMLDLLVEQIDKTGRGECVWRNDNIRAVATAGCCGEKGESVVIRKEPPPRPPLMIGDLIIISTGKALHHAGIWITDSQIWHSLNTGVSISVSGRVCKGGVQLANMADPMIYRHLFAIYRALAR